MMSFSFFDFYIKTPLVFVHFLASAFALVSILRADFDLTGHLSSPLSHDHHAQFTRLKRQVSWLLLVLWLTGAIFIISAAVQHPDSFYLNEKLWMKLVVVMVLTCNGVALHVVSGAYCPGVVFLRLRARWAMLFMGAVSSVSWVWACFLGVARSWNERIDFISLGVLYLMSLGAGVLLAKFFLSLATQGRDKSFPF